MKIRNELFEKKNKRYRHFLCVSFHLAFYVLAQTFLSRHYVQNIFITMVKLYNTIEIRALFFCIVRVSDEFD